MRECWSADVRKPSIFLSVLISFIALDFLLSLFFPGLDHLYTCKGDSPKPLSLPDDGDADHQPLASFYFLT